jgi:hypothetical protein
MSFAKIPASRDSNGEPAARRRKFRALWVVVILAVVCIVGAAVLAIAMATLVMFTPSEEAVTAEQRKLVVDIRAVAAQIDDYAPDASRETAVQRRYFDRSVDIDYTYERAAGDDIYVKCVYSMAATPGEAKVVYRERCSDRAWKKALAVLKNVELVERNDIFRWGDESRLVVVRAEGKPRGNIFVARKGAAVFYLLITGACFDKQEAFSSLVRPTLARIDASLPSPFGRGAGGEGRTGGDREVTKYSPTQPSP